MTPAERAKRIADEVNVDRVATDVNDLVLRHIDQDVEGTELSYQALRRHLRGLVAEVVKTIFDDLEGKGRRAR